MFSCSKVYIFRFNLDAAKKMIEKAAKWRTEVKPELITVLEFEREYRKGVLFIS